MPLTEINSIEDLRAIDNDPSGDYILMRSLDFSDPGSYNDSANMSSYTEGDGWAPIGPDFDTPFQGTLDGQGFLIKNLFIDRATTGNIGLFGYSVTGSEIRDLGLVDVNVTGGSNVGAFSGASPGLTLERCHSTGSISGTGNYVGGLEGGEATINQCFSTASVSGNDQVGGLAGGSSAISDSYAHGTVAGSDYVGGVIGINTATIANCYASGAITAGEGSTYVGGIAGGDFGTITNCYWNTDTTGIAGGKSTAEMTDYENSYPQMDDEAGNDFASDPWKNPPVSWNEDQADPANSGYPALAWQSGPEEPQRFSKISFFHFWQFGKMT